MVRSGKRALADVALEGFVSRVLPEVARELVRPRETPRATLPVADVRLLAWRRIGDQNLLLRIRLT